MNPLLPKAVMQSASVVQVAMHPAFRHSNPVAQSALTVQEGLGYSNGIVGAMFTVLFFPFLGSLVALPFVLGSFDFFGSLVALPLPFVFGSFDFLGSFVNFLGCFVSLTLDSFSDETTAARAAKRRKGNKIDL
jgi:hypothetical protein